MVTFISVDNTRASVTMGELRQHEEVVLPAFNGEHKDAMVTAEEQVLTLRPEERGTHNLFVNTDEDSKRKLGPPLMDEDWLVLCQALYQSIG